MTDADVPFVIFIFLVMAAAVLGLAIALANATTFHPCMAYHHVASGTSQVVRIGGHMYANVVGRACQ